MRDSKSTEVDSSDFFQVVIAAVRIPAETEALCKSRRSGAIQPGSRFGILLSGGNCRSDISNRMLIPIPRSEGKGLRQIEREVSTKAAFCQRVLTSEASHKGWYGPDSNDRT